LFNAEGLQREAAANAEEFAEFARRVGDVAGVLQASAWQARCLVALGEWDRALELVESAAADDAPHMPKTMLEGNAMAVLVARGELERPRQFVDSGRETTDPNEASHVAGTEAWEAEVLLAEGRAAEALAAAEKVLPLRDELGLTNGLVLWSLQSALLAAADLRDREKLDELFAIIAQAPPGLITPELRAIGARFGARRGALEGDATTAEAGFAAAARLYADLSWPFDVAIVRLEHAEWLAGESRINEAQPLAAEAREIFERLRAKPYLERLDRLPVAATAPAG
jgi:hypothetical protein